MFIISIIQQGGIHVRDFPFSIPWLMGKDLQITFGNQLNGTSLKSLCMAGQGIRGGARQTNFSP